MKNIIQLLIGLFFVLTITGCAKSGDSDNNGNTDTTETPDTTAKPAVGTISKYESNCITTTVVIRNKPDKENRIKFETVFSSNGEQTRTVIESNKSEIKGISIRKNLRYAFSAKDNSKILLDEDNTKSEVTRLVTSVDIDEVTEKITTVSEGIITALDKGEFFTNKDGSKTTTLKFKNTDITTYRNNSAGYEVIENILNDEKQDIKEPISYLVQVTKNNDGSKTTTTTLEKPDASGSEVTIISDIQVCTRTAQ